MRLRYFLLEPTKKFSPKNEEKTKRFQKYPWNLLPSLQRGGCFFYSSSSSFFFLCFFLSLLQTCWLFFFPRRVAFFFFLCVCVRSYIYFLINFGWFYFIYFYYFNEVSIYTQFFFKSIMCYFLFYLIGT